MSPSEVRSMSSAGIVSMLTDKGPQEEALAWLASLISDPSMVAGVNELSCRYAVKSPVPASTERARCAMSVRIDPAKYRHFFWRRRIPLCAMGPMVGKSDGLGSVIASKGRMGYWTADALATELGMHVDALIAEIGTPEELERLGF